MSPPCSNNNVYACREYEDADRSMLELVFAPAGAKFGGKSSDDFGQYEVY